MDATAFWDERNKQKNEDQYQLSLARAATGDMAAATFTGRQLQQADPYSSMYKPLARGGLAQARRPYLVGEKGPELIVPKEDGTVIPNNKLRKLQAILRKKTAVPRAKGGDLEAGGAPPWPSAEDMVNMAPVVTPGAPVPAAPATIAPTGAADLAAAAAVRPPGFTPIRTSQGGSMVLGTNDLGVQEIRGTGHPSWQVYQSTGKGADYPAAVANWRKEQDTHTNDLAKAGLTAESQLEAARISKPYQNTEAGVNFLANAELRNPERVAKAEADRAVEATRVGGENVAALGNYLKNAHGAFVDNKVVFKPADEGMARDALASEQVAKAAGAPAAISHFQERQAVRSYLKTPGFMKTVQNPNAFDANAYLGAASQNPAVWNELVARGRALKVTTPPAATTSTDPALQRLQNVDRDWKTSTTRGAELLNRGVRQVIPGASAVINEKGQLQNPF